MYCVYEHLFPNGKRYIGITSTKPEVRWRNGKGYETQTKIARAIEHYGWDNIQHNVIADNLTKDQAATLERYLIASLDTIDNGYNVAIGGENIKTCFLNRYVLDMLRYAKERGVTHYLQFKNGKIDIVKLVDGDRNNELASGLWNEASEAVKKKHRKYSTTSFRDVSEYWWHMLEYYHLWLLMQMGVDVSGWKEAPYGVLPSAINS